MASATLSTGSISIQAAPSIKCPSCGYSNVLTSGPLVRIVRIVATAEGAHYACTACFHVWQSTAQQEAR